MILKQNNIINELRLSQPSFTKPLKHSYPPFIATKVKNFEYENVQTFEITRVVLFEFHLKFWNTISIPDRSLP